MRTVQAQALSQGFLLLDTDGHARYLADSTTSPTAVNLPEGMKVSRITTNKDQAMIAGRDGRLWAWKPGKTPIRAGNKGQAYTQATAAGNRITAIDRQGSIFTWNLDAQDKQNQPDRLDTTQAPILESASMDGQPLKLSKKDDLWHAEIPTRQPGQTAILIAGKQDEQPFTRDLKYTVDQTLTRDASRKAGHSVSFNATGGDPTPDPQQILYPYGRVKRPTPNPTREGYQFDGWFIDNIAYDFSKPVTKDLILTAHWTSGTWTMNPDKGSQLGEQETTITPPPGQGIKFSQISGGKDYNTGFSLAVGSDGNAYAWGDNKYGQLGDGTTIQRTTPVMVKKPDHKTYPDLPADFTYVQVSAGGQHSLAVGSDGYAYAWGHNGFGQLGNDSIPMGQFNSNAKCLVPVRVRDPDSPTDTSKGLKATQVSAGYDHSLATGNNGNTYAWGDNKYGQLGDGTTIQRATPVMAKIPDQKTYADLPGNFTYVQVSAGGDHSLAVGSDGHAYAWGYNYYGQLGSNTSDNHSSIPVRVRDPDSPTDTSKGLKATQVSGGQEHSLAVGSNGHAYAWGLNSYGQLGDNTRNNRTIPVKVFDSNQSTSSADHRLNAVLVSGGWRHSLAISTDGNANTWGENRYGQLGDDSRNDSNVPVSVVFNLTPVIVGVRFDISSGANLTSSDGSSVSVLTPAH